jgi:hypothetical protein
MGAAAASSRAVAATIDGTSRLGCVVTAFSSLENVRRL